MLTTSDVIRVQAHELYESGKFRDAICCCLQAISVNPVIPWPYLLAGKCHYRLNEIKSSRGHLKRFLELIKPGITTQTSTTEAKRLLAMMEKI